MNIIILNFVPDNHVKRYGKFISDSDYELR